MVRSAVLLMESVIVPLVSLVNIVKMNAPVEGMEQIAQIFAIVTSGTALSAILKLANVFVFLVSKDPDVTSLVKTAFTDRTARNHAPCAQVMRSVPARKHMETAHALLVTKDTAALMTVACSIMGCIVSSRASVQLKSCATI